VRANSEVLRTRRFDLRPPRRGDVERFLGAVERSRPFHRELVEPPAGEESFDAYVRRSAGDTHRGFLVETRHGTELVGAVNLNNIVRGGLQSASLGYYRLSAAGGRHAIREAVSAVIGHGFGRLGLHRLEANILPDNLRSRQLAASLGFRCEGLSLEYLRVGGRWRDHERWALLHHEWTT